MQEISGDDIVRALFWRGKNTEGPTDSRVEVLTSMVLDLMMEVRALREALIRSSLGDDGKDSVLAKAYRESALLTHNSAGVSSGLMKLIYEFYPRHAGESESTSEPRVWREGLLLKRLGFSDQDIARYKDEAVDSEMYT